MLVSTTNPNRAYPKAFVHDTVMFVCRTLNVLCVKTVSMRHANARIGTHTSLTTLMHTTEQKRNTAIQQKQQL